MKVTLVSHTPDPLMVCAEAASVCYNSKPSLMIVKGCIASGHTSVLEHASFTFRIEGISRSCSHQLVRHRMASYSQQSQRYVKYDDPIDWVIPEGYDIYDEGIVRTACDSAQFVYKQLSENSTDSRSTDRARCLLPNATPTIIYVTMNIRGLMNFFNERLCNRASDEIRKVALKMKEAIVTASDISKEQTDIFKTIFVPKCMKQKIHFCPESKRTTCGMIPTLEELVKGSDKDEQL